MPRLLRDRSGATAIEYGLIAAFISIAVLATLPLIKSDLGSTYQKIADSLGQT